MEEFSFSVYSNRWESSSTYRVKKTNEGWHISHIAINGDCEPDGKPYFYSNFKQDSISYPSSFGSQLELLWRQLDQGEIDTLQSW